MVNRFLTEGDKREICSWQYEGEYAIYNMPSYEVLTELKKGFMDPAREKDYRAFFVDGRLIGFTRIQEESNEILIGIGVRPDSCGKHYGRRILEEICRISKEQYPDKPLSLVVRTWNTRAIQCYKSAGFQIEGAPYRQKTKVGEGLFYKMTRKI